MKPIGQQNYKLAQLEQWMAQAEFDINQRLTNGERGPGYTYYYHDAMDHLVRHDAKYHSIAYVDPSKPGGYVNRLFDKGYRNVDTPELIEIVRRQQEGTYKALGVTPPWQTAAPQPEVRRAK